MRRRARGCQCGQWNRPIRQTGLPPAERHRPHAHSKVHRLPDLCTRSGKCHVRKGTGTDPTLVCRRHLPSQAPPACAGTRSSGAFFCPRPCEGLRAFPAPPMTSVVPRHSAKRGFPDERLVIQCPCRCLTSLKAEAKSLEHRTFVRAEDARLHGNDEQKPLSVTATSGRLDEAGFRSGSARQAFR